MAKDVMEALTAQDEYDPPPLSAEETSQQDRDEASLRGVEIADPKTDAKVAESDSGHYARAFKQLEESNTRIEDLFKKRQEAIEPIREDLEVMAGQAPKQVPRVGKELEEQPKPPDRRQMMQEFQENTNGLMVAFSALAMFGAMRNGPTAALNFLGGAFDGLAKGQADQAAQAWKQFEAETSRVIQKNKDIMGEYKAVLENKKLDFDQKVELQKIVASKYDDRIAHEMLQRKDFVTLEALFAKRDAANIQLQRALAALAAQKAKAEAAALAIQGAQSEATLRRMAKDYVDTGDERIRTGIGNKSGSQAADKRKLEDYITEERNARGITAQDIQVRKGEAAGLQSAERAGGTLQMRTERFANEALGMVSVAEDASKQVPRSQFVPVNTAIELWQRNRATPEQAQFAQANFALVTTYVKAINPQSGGTESQRKEAMANLSTATSHEAYLATLQIIRKEIETARQSAGKTRAQIRQDYLRDTAPKGTPQQAVDDPLGILH